MTSCWPLSEMYVLSVLQKYVQLRVSDLHSNLYQFSRQRLDSNLQTVFPLVIETIRKYCGPFALHRIWKELEDSAYYDVAVVQLPPGASWVCQTTLANAGFEPSIDILFPFRII